MQFLKFSKVLFTQYRSLFSALFLWKTTASSCPRVLMLNLKTLTSNAPADVLV